MQRGQAFDAFKLLIAAVIAGAILVILLNIIGGISISSEDPLRIMGQELKEVRGGGRASVSSNPVRFQTDEFFEADSVARSAELNIGDVGFCCESGGVASDKCTGYEFPSEQFDCSEDELTVIQGVQGKIRAYCPVERTEKCIIGFRAER